MIDNEWVDLRIKTSRIFTPNTPVDERSLFAGRIDQVRRVVEVVGQVGQHAIIFGERGVGKTSLGNVLHGFLADSEILATRVNCVSGDSFASVWRRIFDQIELIRTETPAGFLAQKQTVPYDATDLLGSSAITPDTVRRVLTTMARDIVPILIFDEFDRLPSKPRRAFADTIKSLSDHAIAATIVLIGVADSVEHLVEQHHSVGRALVQIQMPRMTSDEIGSIIDNGVRELGMTIDVKARDRLVLLAQGLPHYAHLIGLHSAWGAVDRHTTIITVDIFNQAINRALEDAQHSIRMAYSTAVSSTRKANLFREILLSCALARTDDLGFFSAPDVRGPLRRVTSKDYDTRSFAQHLNEFSDGKRGKILKKIGQHRRYRYRFSDPLMQPFVIMQGVVAAMIPDDVLG